MYLKRDMEPHIDEAMNEKKIYDLCIFETTCLKHSTWQFSYSLFGVCMEKQTALCTSIKPINKNRIYIRTKGYYIESIDSERGRELDAANKYTSKRQKNRMNFI